MEVANAGIYDGAFALAEAVLMARTIKTKGSKSEGIHPYYRQAVKTYLSGYKGEVLICPLSEEGYTDLEKLEKLYSPCSDKATG